MNDYAYSKDETYDRDLKNKCCYKSEELLDLKGLYTLHIIEGEKLKVITIVWRDMENRKTLNVDNMLDYKYYIYKFKDYYEIEIRSVRIKDDLVLDGAELYVYKVERQNFKIIGRRGF
jgi:hypothetical protein